MFKIRASQAHNLMGITTLGKTGENYCKQWLISELYSKKKEIKSKYIDKGNIVEDNAIDFISEKLGCGFIIKNEAHFENDFMTGTPDIILNDHIIDVKSSWDCFTFPIFDDKLPNLDYYYQGQVYMELTGIRKFKIIYVLMDTPINIIEREAHYWCIRNGYDDLDEDILNVFIEKMTYNQIDPNLRIKVFEFNHDISVVNKLNARVTECRNLIDSLKSKLTWSE